MVQLCAFVTIEARSPAGTHEALVEVGRALYGLLPVRRIWRMYSATTANENGPGGTSLWVVRFVDEQTNLSDFVRHLTQADDISPGSWVNPRTLDVTTIKPFESIQAIQRHLAQLQRYDGYRLCATDPDWDPVIDGLSTNVQ